MPTVYNNTLECIEGHNAGMPVKVVFLPFVQGNNMMEKREYLFSRLDHVRKLLTFEPRSGSNSYGVVITSPSSNDAHFGAVYFDPSGWHDMCGHATIFIASLAVQRGLVDVKGKESVNVKIDTPAGRVEVTVHLSEDGEIDHLSLLNVPSFIQSVLKVELDKYGEIEIPIVFGGDFYAIVDLDEIGVKYSGSTLGELVQLTKEILAKLEGNEIKHPVLDGVSGIYGVRYHSRIEGERNKMYGVLLFGTPERVSIDRSPSGTSSSAHLAYLYYLKKQLGIGERIEFLSSIDTRFIAEAKKEVEVGGKKAIIPEISTVDKGCYITAFSSYLVDEDDPLLYGFKPLEPL